MSGNNLQFILKLVIFLCNNVCDEKYDGNTAWKGGGVSGQCYSTAATEGSPTDGADVNNERSSCVPTITASATVP